ncbi:MAG TPA: cob(I)yrinic acid a,c-diamide adenosyltransferase [Desulfomonilaceae bacterium]|nr:cob(I)yrinic acid a,c-diamide adenosyltransferase [Desulfomonilaceae bacterium]
MNGPGRIQVFTGEGKGKTTAALGLAVRAIGRGLKVFMVQFLKAPDTSGEHTAVQSLAPMLIIKAMGRKGFIKKQGPDPLDTRMAELALQEACKAMLSGSYDVIILDEVNIAVNLRLISVQRLLEFLDSKPANVEVVLTGRYAHPEIISRADAVQEMKKIKHHFDKGGKARKGFEY